MASERDEQARRQSTDKAKEVYPEVAKVRKNMDRRDKIGKSVKAERDQRLGKKKEDDK